MANRVFLNKPLVIASRSYGQRLALPAARVVYFIFGGERLLYIGATANLRQRLISHHRTADFIKEDNVRVVWVDIPRHWRLGLVERWAIDNFEPSLNYKPKPRIDIVTIKVTPESRYWLKYIASVQGEQMYETIERLTLAESSKLELADGRLATWAARHGKRSGK